MREGECIATMLTIAIVFAIIAPATYVTSAIGLTAVMMVSGKIIVLMIWLAAEVIHGKDEGDIQICIFSEQWFLQAS